MAQANLEMEVHIKLMPTFRLRLLLARVLSGFYVPQPRIYAGNGPLRRLARKLHGLNTWGGPVRMYIW